MLCYCNAGVIFCTLNNTIQHQQPYTEWSNKSKPLFCDNFDRYWPTRRHWATTRPSTAQPMLQLLYLYWPTHAHCPTNHRRPWSLQHQWQPLTTSDPVHVLHMYDMDDGSPCKILQLCVALFQRRSQNVNACLWRPQLFIRFSNSFTGTVRSKFALNWSLPIPPHYKEHATLSYQYLYSKAKRH